MLVIAITGGIGSGKTTVAQLFAERGVTVIDTDQIARAVTQPGQKSLSLIAEKFGNDILLSDNTLDRVKLRKIIFADEKKRLWLEKLLHPLIRIEMQKQIAMAQSPYCLVIIPLLLETEPNPIIDRILVVDAPEDQQLTRTHLRDQVTTKEVQSIIDTQISREKRLAAADDVIYNHGSLEMLIPEVEKLHQFYLSQVKHK